MKFSFYKLVKIIDPPQNSIRRVADNYLFNSAPLSMFRFYMTLDLYLKLGASIEFQEKQGILSSAPPPPSV